MIHLEMDDGAVRQSTEGNDRAVSPHEQPEEEGGAPDDDRRQNDDVGAVSHVLILSVPALGYPPQAQDYSVANHNLLLLCT